MDKMIGMKIERLTIIGYGESYTSKSSKYKCKRYRVICECGKIKDMTKGVLLNKKTKSCGCYSAEIARINGKAKKTHGETKSITYKSWVSMKSRCYCENTSGYSSYGGKGIKVCDEWIASYNKFVFDMGHRPIGKTLDRIDPLGDYTKENCRWATPKEQANNRSTTKLTDSDKNNIIDMFNSGVKAKLIAEKYGITFGYVYTIIKALYKLKLKELK